jgi:hypothetical protein
MFKRFFGEEGLKDVGLDVTTLIPVGNSALTISGNLLQGGFLVMGDQQNISPPPAGSGRLSLFAPLAKHSEVDIGFSGLYAQHDLVNKRWTTLGDFDFKYKWKPDIYRSLIVVVEGLINSRKVESDTMETGMVKKVTSYGAFAAFDYQFRRRYDAGAFVDFGQSPTDQQDQQTGFGAFVAFSLAEETYRVGILLRQDQGSDINKAYQTIEVQLLWSLGPHKPHQF